MALHLLSPGECSRCAATFQKFESTGPHDCCPRPLPPAIVPLERVHRKRHSNRPPAYAHGKPCTIQDRAISHGVQTRRARGLAAPASGTYRYTRDVLSACRRRDGDKKKKHEPQIKYKEFLVVKATRGRGMYALTLSMPALPRSIEGGGGIQPDALGAGWLCCASGCWLSCLRRPRRGNVRAGGPGTLHDVSPEDNACQGSTNGDFAAFSFSCRESRRVWPEPHPADSRQPTVDNRQRECRTGDRRQDKRTPGG